jgi:5-methylcytosine-specific restriction endonuclease McrA
VTARRGLSTAALDARLAALGVPATPESRAVIRKLASEPSALHATIRELAALRPWDASRVPDVDCMVDKAMTEMFGDCTDPSLLKKGVRMGKQNRLLLAYLLERVGQPVQLQELLVTNGLHNATSRRVRELATEHGHFAVEVVGTGETTAYVLRHSKPDIEATAHYWLKRNIRSRKKKTITPHERLIALLSARLGDPVSIDDLAYVLPKHESSGKGRARTPQLAVARRVRELRERGWQVHSGKDKTRVDLAASDYVLETLDRLPEYERIKAKVRDDVLEAAKHRCKKCGWGPEDGRTGKKKQLEVHHKHPQRARPEDVNDPANLMALCNVCHAGVEAKLKKQIPPTS